MYRNLLLVLIVLSIASFLVAQEPKDPLLRHHVSQSEKRMKTSNGSPHSTLPPSSRTKSASVDAQLNQIEHETIKSQGPAARSNAYPTFTAKANTTRSSNQPVNFQYHAPKTTATTQSGSASGGGVKTGGIHRIR